MSEWVNLHSAYMFPCDNNYEQLLWDGW